MILDFCNNTIMSDSNRFELFSDLTEFRKLLLINFTMILDFWNSTIISDSHGFEFEAFIEEVSDILTLSTQNPQSLQKSKNYLELKIPDLEYGKQRFSRYDQVHQINLLVDELRQIKNQLKIKKEVISVVCAYLHETGL